MKKLFFGISLFIQGLNAALVFGPTDVEVLNAQFDQGNYSGTNAPPKPIHFPKFLSRPGVNPLLLGSLMTPSFSFGFITSVSAGIYQFDNNEKAWVNTYGFFSPLLISILEAKDNDKAALTINYDAAMNGDGDWIGAVFYYDQATIGSGAFDTTGSILVSQDFISFPGDMVLSEPPSIGTLALETIETDTNDDVSTYAFPQIATDDAGHAAVLYKEFLLAEQLGTIPKMKGSVFNGVTWVSVPAIEIGDGYSGLNENQQLMHQVAGGGDVTDGGQIIGVWFNQTTGEYQSSNVNSGATGWEAPSTIASSVLFTSNEGSPVFFNFNADTPESRPSNVIAVGVDGSGMAHCLYTVAAVGANPIIEAKSKAPGAGAWSTATVISSGGIARHPRIAVRSNGTAMAVWDEGPAGAEQIMAKIFDGIAWQEETFTVSQTPGAGYPQVALEPNSDKAIVTWASNDTTPAYKATAALFDGTSFADEAPISYDGQTDINKKVLLTTADYTGDLPKITYTVNTDGKPLITQFCTLSSAIALEGGSTGPTGPTGPTETVEPPTNLQGTKIKNKFALQTDNINRITWTASTTSDVTGYTIYRNGTLIGFSPSYQLFFDDHNRRPGVVSTYSVITQTSSGFSTSESIQF